ncbi:hypothetical protein AKJ09_01595 [Labilithrix luteola]|uniref:Tryptophan synthase alpha chain n=1 Tax=Labilithrix luteola TaxID=1391654 RepID=A0A0K1PNG0_9BACT|nr:hypothetical protein [Labilithrix luteola]AKU94931.1 hypothetical protein AKJ09_01595 [Labilithrix luteola]
MNRFIVCALTSGAFISISAIIACSTTTRPIGEVVENAPPSFTASDGGDGSTAEAPDAASEVLSYCPSDHCPTEYATCPTSDFPCDVNLLTDPKNCGTCGHACPTSGIGSESYECIDGRCAMVCSSGRFDCDGIPDNGCESSPWDQDSCGKCGVVCSDPTKPCLLQLGTVGKNIKACGCLAGQYCQGQCVDTTTADSNCGGCGQACPRNGDGGTVDPSLHMFYGCSNSECGHIKCESGWADCDGSPANGCETNMLSPNSCGDCNNICADGQFCKKDRSITGYPPQCMCPEGKSFCAYPYDTVSGTCVDFSSDSSNCGGCNVTCAGSVGAAGKCIKGKCKLDCVDGRADCNGNDADGCEVKVDTDPHNCGGCGIVCDAIAGQACVQGRCAVEPCSEVDGGEVVPR